jgi:hypothetical protein
LVSRLKCWFVTTVTLTERQSAKKIASRTFDAEVLTFIQPCSISTQIETMGDLSLDDAGNNFAVAVATVPLASAAIPEKGKVQIGSLKMLSL